MFQGSRGLQVLIEKSSKQKKSNSTVCQFYKPIQQIATHSRCCSIRFQTAYKPTFRHIFFFIYIKVQGKRHTNGEFVTHIILTIYSFLPHSVQVTKPRMNCLSIDRAMVKLPRMYVQHCLHERCKKWTHGMRKGGLTPPSVESSFLIAGCCPPRSLIDQQAPTSMTVVSIP